MGQAKAPTLDDLRKDTAAVLAYLRALAVALPGHVDPDLLALLESAGANSGVLELLLGALTRVR